MEASEKQSGIFVHGRRTLDSPNRRVRRECRLQATGVSALPIKCLEKQVLRKTSQQRIK